MKNKTNDIRHELLSELHYLLSIASAGDFIEASKLCKSDNIKLALEALAREHTGNLAEEVAIPSDGKKSSLTKPSKTKEKSPTHKRSDVHILLSDSSRFKKKQDLLDFAKSNGIAFKMGEKESRERGASRLVKLITALPSDKQQAIQNRLAEGFDSQTAGWARVIKRPS
jgi:hypothetical protein